MSAQPLRFLLAIGLMFVVLIGTNLMFPPVVPEPGLVPDSTAAGGTPSIGPQPGTTPITPALPGGQAPPAEPGATLPQALSETLVTVEGPLYQLRFSSFGARLVAAELPLFRALNRDGDGAVDLVPSTSSGYLSQKIVVGADTVDLSRAPYRVEPEDGFRLAEGGGGGTLRFVYEHPSSAFRFEVTYAFEPGEYLVRVEGRLEGLDRALLLTDLGEGIAFAEADSASEARMHAYAYNHLDRGIESVRIERADPGIVQGPLLWAAFRSKFFVIALLAGASDQVLESTDYLGGLIVGPGTVPDRVSIAAAQSVGNDGAFAYRLFLGPQDYERLQSLGEDMEEVNPYGWRVFRPIIRPFVSIIIAILVFLHENLSLGYGWVLVVFGIGMRIVLFPLNHRMMKSQMKNMEFQPRLAEAQQKYKNNPERMQQEIKQLYKEGFNPLAGCLPVLLPWPILIALFFVFQNTIELRGVPFLWLPDLSTKDPLYVLPMLLAGSMFLMQWMSLKSIEGPPNQQMKMMMWMLPPFMLIIFLNLASGLNLYYVVSNIATIPQQMWISSERKKLKAKAPAKLKET